MKKFLGFMVLLSSLWGLFSGCASQDHVAEQVAPLTERISKLEANSASKDSVALLAERIGKLEAKRSAELAATEKAKARAAAAEALLYRNPEIERVIRRIGPEAESRLKPFFVRAGVPYPSDRLGFIALKEEMKLELWAENDGKWVYLRTYDILDASGWSGPKLKSGDLQVPEGIYQIIALNPESRFHLSMKINYPNDYDLQRAQEDQRTDLGGDIYIHGRDRSRGCLAMGDPAIEELFVLVVKTGLENVKVIITPHDLRKYGPHRWLPSRPSWLPHLYQTLWLELAKFDLKGGTKQGGRVPAAQPLKTGG